MGLIFHIVPRLDWEQAPPGPYRAPSLTTEGFIHCSRSDQVARIANLFYADAAELLVLAIDVSSLACPMREEEVETGERFPHVYGPIARAAIVAVLGLERGLDGQWLFSATTPGA